MIVIVIVIVVMLRTSAAQLSPHQTVVMLRTSAAQLSPHQTAAHLSQRTTLQKQDTSTYVEAPADALWQEP